ncbi:DUF5317 family protein [Caproiciproducens sp. MSJ-32]|uniref:DUF5317 family protein n=1 Tax=Caproiciproducens sp. MSJ-32 TaxID=2841527 RepID=UPI001C111080|nr:DUF5317 family protein [Caproiciproducens sp. MSJ-32]MBU5454137.1 DUF5317 domain-containing protein [Caproiciproducens sp. MSJ-32]
MLEAIIISLIFSKIKGYKIKGIFKSWTIYPVLALEAIYLFAQVNIFMGNYFMIKYVNILKTIYLCSYLPLIFYYEKYVQAIIGSIFIFLGGFLNDIAIRANNGFMPVFPTLSRITGYIDINAFGQIDNIHILGNESTKLKFLTDIFDIGYSVLSLGDIFMRLYVFIIIYSVIKEINKKQNLIKS